MPESSDRYFAFIRAINVGDRRLTNRDLIAPFESLGFDDVAAYQAAGNITFRLGRAEAARLANLEADLVDHYGFDTSVFVRSREEMHAIVKATPFTEGELASTAGRVQVSFMHREPAASAVKEALDVVPRHDRVVFIGREWFWLPERGVSDSRLPVAAIERIVGPMTMRTSGTIDRIVAKFD